MEYLNLHVKLKYVPMIFNLVCTLPYQPEMDRHNQSQTFLQSNPWPFQKLPINLQVGKHNSS